MTKNNQNRAPIAEALSDFLEMRVVPFDVPGHKRGQGNAELTDFLGLKCMSLDVNSMKPLDNLCHPVSVIREAEILAAEAFGASEAFFMVNGTTSAIQSMIISVCQKDDKLILPRNVHRSTINAMILSGAVPVYVNPGIDERLGIPLGMSVQDIIQAMDRHPDAKAVLVNNPTYYGICSNLKAIVKAAHARGMLVLCDEAHGTHLSFSEHLPISAMAAGADMSSVSMHKSGGSLTQSSFLLCGPKINAQHVRQIINLTQTTSASYLLLASLDLSRKKLALNGEDIFAKVTQMAEYARSEINRIGDYYAFSSELIDGDLIFDFDVTKLAVNTLDIGLAGVEVYDYLRDEYDIQIEFGDVGNMLAYISIGDRLRDIERLVGALSEIRRRHKKSGAHMLETEYVTPVVMLPPRDAFFAPYTSVKLEESRGRICSEFVMCYPPGIPILAPGEQITSEIIEHIRYVKSKGSFLTGTQDPAVESINVIK